MRQIELLECSPATRKENDSEAKIIYKVWSTPDSTRDCSVASVVHGRGMMIRHGALLVANASVDLRPNQPMSGGSLGNDDR